MNTDCLVQVCPECEALNSPAMANCARCSRKIEGGRIMRLSEYQRQQDRRIVSSIPLLTPDGWAV